MPTRRVDPDAWEDGEPETWDDDGQDDDEGDDPDPDDDAEDADGYDTQPCPFCGEPVYEDAPRCPHCGEYVTELGAPPRRKPWWIVLGALACLYVVWRWVFG